MCFTLCELSSKRKGERMSEKEIKILSNLEMLMRVGEKPEIFALSGFETLDEYMKGFRLGELVTISGITKHGKTEFCRTLTRNFVRQGHNPLWISFEENAREFLHKFKDQSRDLLFYMPDKLEIYNPDWCIDAILTAKKQHDIKIVFIDNLHYLVDIASFKNPSLIIGSVVRKIKRLAIDCGLVIFLVCHIQKVKMESENDIDFSLIRDSSFIAQESDAVIFLYRKVKSDGIVHMDQSFLKLCFHRYTGCMDRLIPLVLQGGCFEEIGFE